MSRKKTASDCVGVNDGDYCTVNTGDPLAVPHSVVVVVVVVVTDGVRRDDEIPETRLHRAVVSIALVHRFSRVEAHFARTDLPVDCEHDH